MHLRRATVLLGALLVGGTAQAEPLAALAPAADPWRAELVGPSGQLWLPDGAGAWELRGAGGAAADVAGVVHSDGPVIVGKAAPFYARRDDAWHAVRLGERGRTVAGSGPHAAIAVGRQVFVWSRQRWTRAATAPAAITAVWAASDTQLYVAGADTVWRLRGKRLLPHATVALRAFASGASPAPWAITTDGALYEVTRKIASSVTVGGAAVAVERVAEGGGAVWIAARRGDAWVIARRDGASWVEVPGPGLAPTDALVGFAVAPGRGPMLVTQAGAIWLHDAGTWRAGILRIVPIVPRPGPGPARTAG